MVGYWRLYQYAFGGVLENKQTKKIKKAGERLYESFIDELSNISSSVVPQQRDVF